MLKLLNIVKEYWIALTLLALTAITVLSVWPLEHLPSAPGTDKTQHLVAYAFLMLPTAIRRPTNWILYGLLFTAYSGVLEVIQPYVNRYGEWMDLLANVAGLLCGVVIAQVIIFLTSAKTSK